MIHCLSCTKYPKDGKVIPFGATFPTDRYMVKLLCYSTPANLPQDGDDVDELANGTKFAYGSLLYVVNGEGSTPDTYVFVDDENGFVKWESEVPFEAE